MAGARSPPACIFRARRPARKFPQSWASSNQAYPDGRCVRSVSGDAAATACAFSLARLGIGGRVRAILLEKPRTDKIAHPGGTRRFAILAAMAKAAAPKKIFLVDAMGFIFRAYFAPMARLNSPAGVPTKVPYLFSNMLRKLQKEHAPDYLAVVFDTKEPTFRDKLFDKYKAQRPPMPEDLSVQLPYVRRMCEAMRLPILEFPGFEADDVIGALCQAGARKRGSTFPS